MKFDHYFRESNMFSFLSFIFNFFFWHFQLKPTQSDFSSKNVTTNKEIFVLYNIHASIIYSRIMCIAVEKQIFIVQNKCFCSFIFKYRMIHICLPLKHFDFIKWAVELKLHYKLHYINSSVFLYRNNYKNGIESFCNDFENHSTLKMFVYFVSDIKIFRLL